MVQTNPQTLLLVDDEQNILLALKRELHVWARDNKLEIVTAESARAGLVFLKDNAERTIMIMSDLRMPEMKGSDFLIEVKHRYPEIITLLLTGYSDSEEIFRAISAGIFSFMLKPWERPYLLAELQKALDHYTLKKENDTLMTQRTEDLKLAGELQKSILRPSVQTTDGIEIRTTSRAAKGLYCSGDYYDVIFLGQERYLFLIGDVEGPEIRSALVTAILKSVIYPEYVRNFRDKAFSPSDFLSWLNDRLHFEFRGMDQILVTFFAALMDLREHTFTYSNAGHTHPFMYRAGVIEELPKSGSPLGFAQKTLYPETALTVRQNDFLLLYTIGISGQDIELRKREILGKVPVGDEFHQRLMAAVLSESGENEFTGDFTILTALVR